MTKKMMTGLNLFAVVCLALFLMAACAKKQVQVSPTSATEESISGGAGQGESMSDLEAMRQKRLAELRGQQEGEGIGGHGGIFFKKIYFEYDRSDLSTEARSILKEMADALNADSSISIDIAGHCDERGTIEYNLALGERRAHAAKKYLTDLGVSVDRISTVSYGEERPVDTRSIEEAWAKNRRDEFKAIK